MLRSNSKQSGGIHVVKSEERKGKAAVGRIRRKGRYQSIKQSILFAQNVQRYTYKAIQLRAGQQG